MHQGPCAFLMVESWLWVAGPIRVVAGEVVGMLV